MAIYYVKSGSGTAGSGTFRGVWTAATTYAAGDRVVTTRAATAARQCMIYECTTGGASHATTEPTWDSTAGNTTTDNAVTWTCRACTTWANAHMFLDMLLKGDAAGDTIYVSHQHAETSAAALLMAEAGTATAPTYVICVNDGAEPPTALATTATITTTGTNDLTCASASSAHSYFYGITFSCGTGSGAVTLSTGVNTSLRVFDNCNFVIGSTSTTAVITCSGPAVFKNCGFKFANASQTFTLTGGKDASIVEGGSILSGGTSPTNFINTTAFVVGGTVVGFDFSNASAGINLTRTTGRIARWSFRNCRLPASWSGALLSDASGTTGVDHRVEMHNCDSADTNYRVRVQDRYGQLNQETTLIRTGGASDGTTGLAWKIVTTASSLFAFPFTTPEVVQWVGSTGSKTVTVEILHDSATNLTDAEIWVEVMYLGTSGYPLGTWTRDRAADILATPADQTDSSETWTTTGMANPNTQKLSVTVTVNEIGPIHARICVAKTSTTVYVCPELTIT